MRMKPDARDILAAAGLGIMGYGLWQVSPSVALIVVGTVLLAIALFTSIFRKESGA